MTSLTREYDRDDGPTLTLALNVGDRRAVVDVVVDSGADRSLLPFGVARELGIDRALRLGSPGEGVSGRSFRTWRYAAPIEAEVVIDGDTGELWETRFELEPAFSRLPAAVLGRVDFFGRFLVLFDEIADPPRFLVSESLNELLD